MYRFGVDYYPEHWPRGRWERDAQLMQEAGINTVRMAEFAWSLLEPSDGVYDFQWLDDALEILSHHGIQAILGTPTASPPPWLMALLPSAYRVRLSRQRAQYGGRREYCPSHDGFIERCRSVVSEMAAHYAEHPAVIGWQIDNEFSKLCYCAHCHSSFREWLREKYGSLEPLNRAWGTAFWSHVYTDWDQIPLPEDDGYFPTYGPNPALDLDYRRFSSDAVVRFQEAQLDILRRLCPTQFITHNTGFGLDVLNFFDIARPLDFISLDHYPRSFEPLTTVVEPAQAAFFFDRIRGLKRKNYWMTEAQAGPGGWRTLGMAPRPGELRLWSYQAIAHGADAMIYFRWRTALFGAEQYWHGVLDHDGQPRRRYREIHQVGRELQHIGKRILGAETRAQVAILLSYDSLYAFQNQPNHPDFSYLKLVSGLHAAMQRRNISVDVVAPTDDLDQYRLVLAPALYVVDQAGADNLQRFVSGGGTLLLTARSGVKDTHNNVVEMPLPGLLSAISGATVDEYDVLPTGTTVPLALDLPGNNEECRQGQAQLWCDVLTPSTGTVIATYQSQYYSGRAAATLNQYGQGQVLYLGTLGDAALLDTISGWLLQASAVRPVLETPQGVEAAQRWRDDTCLLFLLNHTDIDQEVVLPTPSLDLLGGEKVQGPVQLEPKSVRILAL
jgi:beta-galactosidase